VGNNRKIDQRGKRLAGIRFPRPARCLKNRTLLLFGFKALSGCKVYVIGGATPFITHCPASFLIVSVFLPRLNMDKLGQTAGEKKTDIFLFQPLPGLARFREIRVNGFKREFLFHKPSMVNKFEKS
jgi:hypothetical protein